LNVATQILCMRRLRRIYGRPGLLSVADGGRIDQRDITLGLLLLGFFMVRWYLVEKSMERLKVVRVVDVVDGVDSNARMPVLLPTVRSCLRYEM
jgi:hypothetical protein